MGRIYFIRHGQASFHKENYDQLSDKGVQQSQLLGEYFNQRGWQFDRVYSGTLKRQKDTALHSLSNDNHPLQFTQLAGLNEHHGPAIVGAYYPDKFKFRGEIPSEKLEEYKRDYYRTYFELAEKWVLNQLDTQILGNIEPWSVFKNRFTQAVQHILADAKKGENIAVYTSGGPVGAALGMSLGLPDTEVVKLAWQVRNTSYSEYVFSKDKFSLVSYNVTSHLQDPTLITLV